jgi:trehalose 6-phosphate synthase
MASTDRPSPDRPTFDRHPGHNSGRTTSHAGSGRTMSGHTVSHRSPLVIVACRLPVHRTTSGWAPSPGGLASALTPIAEERGTRWIGWTGGADDDVRSVHGRIRVSGVPLTADEIEGFYEKFSNATLWPLLHDGLRPSEMDESAWRAYVAVNRRFADRTIAEAPRGAAVWVHDYQLMLVPSMVRAARRDLSIGFFLHTPFPAPELFRRLPWRLELLQGLLGAKAIGFQDQTSAEHFVAAATRFADASDRPGGVFHRGSSVDVRVHPIGVDAPSIDRRGRAEGIEQGARQWRQRLGSPAQLLLGVDRLDYTKGIPERLAAFERLLESGAVSAADTAFVQIAAPSRSSVSGYRELHGNLEDQVRRINARFGGEGPGPVHCLQESLSFEELVPLYRAADVMVVTPLKDGMNLVAKEYVALRHDLGGALVLSEFAGAAAELSDAYVANPYDTDRLARAMQHALQDPPAQRAARMQALREAVFANDSRRWADRSLRMIEQPLRAPVVQRRAVLRHAQEPSGRAGSAA